jgi:hypothetical protein
MQGRVDGKSAHLSADFSLPLNGGKETRRICSFGAIIRPVANAGKHFPPCDLLGNAAA